MGGRSTKEDGQPAHFFSLYGWCAGTSTLTRKRQSGIVGGSYETTTVSSNRPADRGPVTTNSKQLSDSIALASTKDFSALIDRIRALSSPRASRGTLRVHLCPGESSPQNSSSRFGAKR